jgi:hypothetical protein
LLRGLRAALLQLLGGCAAPDLRNGNQTGAITGAAYAKFVKESLRQNKPYDQFVREMVAAQGKAWDNGAIGYYMRDRGMPLDNMANTVRIFLGTRIECAQCHNHPFDKWSQMQFYKMAAFTYGVQTQDYMAERWGVCVTCCASRKKQSAPRSKSRSVRNAQRQWQDVQGGTIAKPNRSTRASMKEYEEK